MTLHVALTHKTEYHYDRLTAMGPQIIRLRPAPHCRTPILSYSLTVDAEAAFPQLAAGPVRQLPRPLRLSRRRRDDFTVTVDLVADMAVINPFDFFLEREPRNVRSPTTPELKKELAPYLAAGRRRAAARRTISPGSTTRAERPSTSWSTSTSRSQRDISYLIRMEPGMQTPEETLRKRVRLLPRQRLAAGADPAPSRPRGALRLRLPDPAEARREVARRPVGHRRAISPTCMPGPKSICPAPAGSGSIPTSGLLAGEGHIPLACDAEPDRAPRRSRAAIEPAEVAVRFRHERDAHRENRRASPSPTPTSNGHAIDDAGR